MCKFRCELGTIEKHVKSFSQVTMQLFWLFKMHLIVLAFRETKLFLIFLFFFIQFSMDEVSLASFTSFFIGNLFLS